MCTSPFLSLSLSFSLSLSLSLYIYIYTLRTNPGKKLDIGNFLPESNLSAGK